MKKIILQSLVATLALLLMQTGMPAFAQKADKPVAVPAIQVIQFHSEHRCVTCLKIEKLTRATLASYFASVPFLLINVDDKKNEKIATEFEASGTALFLYNPQTGKKKNLTSFAFLKSGDEKLFDAELKKHIENFLKE